MNLIHFRGLNCYFNCVVSIAAYLGLNYEDSFATLWSETDFTYDRRHHAYSTKRMLANLEAMGVKLKGLGCDSQKEAEEVLSSCQEGEFIIVGMDAFCIPWSPIYQALHDPHYFFAQKEQPDSFFCFDPTYSKEYMRIMPDDIISHAYDIWRIEKVTEKPPHFGVIEEAQEIICNHPQTQEKLLFEINECTHEKQKNAGSLAKYAAALINNRYLYKHYLQSSLPNADKYQQFFDKDFFLRWEAVKNGLYKASLIKNNESVIDEVCKLFNNLIDEEIAIAKQIIIIA